MVRGTLQCGRGPSDPSACRASTPPQDGTISRVIRFSPEGRTCSFCGVTGGRHTKFAGGLGSMMCSACVTKYYEIFESPRRSKQVQHPPWDDMAAEELLQGLPLIVANARQADEFVHDWVAVIRARKVSWAAIGLVLNVSRQAAWERFSNTSKTKASRGEQPSRG